jgi:RNA polymerase sigma-70 factor (ECF subfamily)
MPEPYSPEEDLSDQELIAAALADGNAYAHIVRRYEAPLRRYLFRLGCKHQSDTDDILQEVFLKAYRNLNDVDTKLKFSSWLYRIAHNEAMTFFRKSTRAPRVARTEDEMAAFEEIADLGNIAEELDARFDAATIRKAIDSLDQKYKEVLVLRFLEDRSYEEISDILRKPPGTVATLIARAKAKLRDALAPILSSL